MANRHPTPIGETFHYLTVVGEAPTGPSGNRKVVAQCACGVTGEFFLKNITRGATKSCGCSRGELVKQAFDLKREAQWSICGEVAVADIGGNTVKIDAADIDKVSDRRWHINAQGYCVTNISRVGVPAGSIRLHRLIVGAPTHLEVDHIDGDRLNNVSSNLRLVNSSQNSMNSRKQTKKVGYKGVDWVAGKRKWKARITAYGTTKHLGYFQSEDEAARSYDIAAKEIHGEYARLNLPEG